MPGTQGLRGGLPLSAGTGTGVLSQELPGSSESSPAPSSHSQRSVRGTPCRWSWEGPPQERKLLPEKRRSLLKRQAHSLLLEREFLKDLLNPPNLCSLGGCRESRASVTALRGLGGNSNPRTGPEGPLGSMPAGSHTKGLVKIRSVTDRGLVLLAKSKEITATNPKPSHASHQLALDLAAGQETGMRLTHPARQRSPHCSVLPSGMCPCRPLSPSVKGGRRWSCTPALDVWGHSAFCSQPCLVPLLQPLQVSLRGTGCPTRGGLTP